MKKILSFLILLTVGLSSYGQTIPRPQPSAVGIGYKRLLADSTLFFPAQSGLPSGLGSLKSNNINRKPSFLADTTGNYVYWFNPKDSVWRRFVHDSDLTGYIPYTGAIDNVNLGTYRLTARSLRTDSIYANSSAGMYLLTNSGAAVAHWGGGGSVEVDFKGFAGYDANRAGSYTARSFTDKNYVDSSAGLRVRYTDTAAMLAPFIQYSDTTGLLSQVVRTFGTQTIGGNKTFSNDIFVNSARIGIGAGGNTSNSVLGYNVFTSNTSGTKNTAVGENALSSNISATDNTAFGWYSLDATSGSGNTGIGSGALGTNTSGSNNTAIGFGAGEYITGSNPNTTGTNSIYIGFNTKAAANGETNQTVIGHNATGNGSNTVTIGNSSVTNNYFSGNVRGAAFIPTGGTSSQFLKADGSLDGTSYATAASLSGYLPLSGGTLSGALSGTSLSMSGNVNAAKGDFGQAFTTSNVLQSFASSATDAALFQAGMAGVSNGFVLKREASVFKMEWDGQATFSGSLSGTSLSMSGAGSFGGNLDLGFNNNLRLGTSPYYYKITRSSAGQLFTYFDDEYDASNTMVQFRMRTAGTPLNALTLFGTANVGIKTTTDNGTDALQVAGSGRFEGQGISDVPLKVTSLWGSSSTNLISASNSSSEVFAVTRAGAATFSSSVTVGGALSFSPSSSKIVSGVTDFAIRNNADNTSMLHFNNSTLAATFAGSVYGVGFKYAYNAVSSNYTLTDNDDYINVTSSCTITLPTAVGRSGKRYVIKCVGSVTATIASTSSQTIDGNAASTYTFGGPNFNIMIVYSDGANWHLEAWATGI